MTRRFQFWRDLWLYMRVRKQWWLAPLLIMILAVGALIVLTGQTALSPLIYILF